MTVETETSSSLEAEEPPAGAGSDRRCVASWRLALAVIVVAAAIAVPVSSYFFAYRPVQQIGEAAAHQAIQAASDGAVAVVSYSPDNLERDFAAAKSHLTGDFLDYYSQFSEQFITPMAREKHITATAKVIRAAVSELHPDSAVVLLFLDQSTATKEKPEPLTSSSSVVVTLTKINGSWLISKLVPV